jgi:hypothetical protein
MSNSGRGHLKRPPRGVVALGQARARGSQADAWDSPTRGWLMAGLGSASGEARALSVAAEARLARRRRSRGDRAQGRARLAGRPVEGSRRPQWCHGARANMERGSARRSSWRPPQRAPHLRSLAVARRPVAHPLVPRPVSITPRSTGRSGRGSIRRRRCGDRLSGRVGLLGGEAARLDRGGDCVAGRPHRVEARDLPSRSGEMMRWPGASAPSVADTPVSTSTPASPRSWRSPTAAAVPNSPSGASSGV